MRPRRTWLALVSVLAMNSAVALAQAQVTPEFLLTNYVPVNKGIDYDMPFAAVKAADADMKRAIDACKVEATEKGYILRDGQGRILRRFLDTNGKTSQRDGEKKPRTHLDQWSYYQDGFEVYREVDSDDDGNLDEVRWMNGGGTRIARVHPVDVKGGKVSRIVAWSRISAEEASKVMVQAIMANDPGLLDTVIASVEEMKELGFPETTLKRAGETAANRPAALSALRKSLGAGGWTNNTTWSRFDGTMPHVIPADAAAGLKGEVLLYENAVVFATPPDGATPDAVAKMAYLSVADVIKVGDCWKFLDLPHPVDPLKPATSTLVSLRSDLMTGGSAEKAKNPELDAALKELAAFDAAGPPAPGSGKKSAAEWHVSRLRMLKKVIQAADDPADKLAYNKQAVSNAAEAWKTGAYPEGAAIVDTYIKQGGKIGSFASYRKVLTQFDIEADEPGANFMEVQKACLARFEKFLEQYGTSDEAPEVLYQLASLNDFNSDEKAARDWFGKLARDFPETPAGKKAAGALRRLDLDGKPLKIAGPGVGGKPVSTEDARGKSVLVVYFISSIETDQKDLRELAALKSKLGGKLEVVGVSLDDDEKALRAYLKEASLPWETIWEPGGMDSKPANELGIISTPTMILVDAQGKVVSRKLRKPAEVEKAMEKSLAGRGVGVSLGVK